MSTTLNLLKVMATSISEKVKERRNRVLLAPLPDDFLRINISAQQQQEASDRQTALALHQQYNLTQGYPSVVGKLSITVVQAKLAKNYGFSKMDPYVRLRIGHSVYETPTDQNGGKNPRWNKVVHSFLPAGINSLTLEIFDERTITVDELVASAQIPIPPQVLQGETHEEWYPLSGKQGEGVEGMVHLILSYTAVPSYMYQQAPPVMVVPSIGGGGVKPLKVFTGGPAPPTAIPVLSESELKQIEEMFPNVEKEVIKTVFEANNGNKDGTINSLLQMAD